MSAPCTAGRVRRSANECCARGQRTPQRSKKCPVFRQRMAGFKGLEFFVGYTSAHAAVRRVVCHCGCHAVAVGGVGTWRRRSRCAGRRRARRTALAGRRAPSSRRWFHRYRRVGRVGAPPYGRPDKHDGAAAAGLGRAASFARQRTTPWPCACQPASLPRRPAAATSNHLLTVQGHPSSDGGLPLHRALCRPARPPSAGLRHARLVVT